MPQTEARKILKDAPVLWRRINSIGIILDCNSTYAANLGYAKSEILGRPIFEHVPKESWQEMNNSLKIWFETGKVTNQCITFKRHDESTFPGLLQATSLYDENKHLLGSNTVIFDLSKMTEEKIQQFQEFFKDADSKLKEIKQKDYDNLDEISKSEFNGLRKMFDVLLEIDLKELKNKNRL